MTESKRSYWFVGQRDDEGKLINPEHTFCELFASGSGKLIEMPSSGGGINHFWNKHMAYVDDIQQMYEDDREVFILDESWEGEIYENFLCLATRVLCILKSVFVVDMSAALSQGKINISADHCNRLTAEGLCSSLDHYSDNYDQHSFLRLLAIAKRSLQQIIANKDLENRELYCDSIKAMLSLFLVYADSPDTFHWNTKRSRYYRRDEGALIEDQLELLGNLIPNDPTGPILWDAIKRNQ